MTSHTPSSHTILHIVLRHTPSYTLSAGVAQGDIHLRFVLRGRRGALSHPLSFCVAGVALMALGGALGLVLVARDAAALCVAGVAQSHIHLRFAWQAWHVWHWVARLGWFWSPVTPRHFAAALCVAGVAQGDIHLRFAWQAWRTLTSTFVLRGRRGTISHPPSFSWQAWHNLTHIFVTHLLSRTIFVTHHLSQSVVTHHPSYNLCQQFSHAHLCHTPPASHSSSSFTHTLSQLRPVSVPKPCVNYGLRSMMLNCRVPCALLLQKNVAREECCGKVALTPVIAIECLECCGLQDTVGDAAQTVGKRM